MRLGMLSEYFTVTADMHGFSKFFGCKCLIQKKIFLLARKLLSKAYSPVLTG
ncbi:hypothetical protein GJA_3233 [Janthinobacterium agaricidamnosum NBRC 102515 = DSM 9628]|uniref:Uncharacterized protein n=1 Tax=Janthinobacterium agaricidamnosum NBRC 102515 = DSM 9628 TaxID=1349767 RepID=W0V929_9BURK|nr:hypothetical protein GJA_3233 [Janthinobacterium agaricidamnosum NBRC 102515 = DSM 9628]